MTTTAEPRTHGAATARRDPLGFLADDIADLKAKNLYRPLRVMSSGDSRLT